MSDLSEAMRNRHLAHGVLWPGFLGMELPEWLEEALNDGLAGVVLFSQNLDQMHPERIAELSAKVRARNSLALIGIDEEGGTVTRLESDTGSTLPGPAQLGALDDLPSTAAVAQVLAGRAARAGVNVVLGPVADVNTDPENPVIGVRAFGSDATAVTRHVTAAVTGLQSGGAIAACVKHFPGHGATRSDSHTSLPVLDLSLAEIEHEHMAPFLAAIDAGVDAIMTAHIVVPPCGELPATLNPAILGKLREHGFQGVIVTDALDMAAIDKSVGAGAGAVLALTAGAGLLCIGNPATRPGANRDARSDGADFLEVRSAIESALAEGRLDPELLARAGARNRALAARLATGTPPSQDLEDEVLARVASAFTISGNVTRYRTIAVILDLRARVTLAMATQDDAFDTAFALFLETKRVGVGILNEPVASLRYLLDSLDPDSDLIVLTDRIGHTGDQSAALNIVASARPDAVVLNLGIVPTKPESTLARIDTRASSLFSARIAAALLYSTARS